MARLLACFERHKERLVELKPRLLVLQFSGAAGTLATITSASSHNAPDMVDGTPLGLRCQELLAAELGLAVPEIAWHTERDSLAEIANYLAVLTATCAKFATDLKLMMQLEVGEAREPYVPHRGSSSTMPQKRNRSVNVGRTRPSFKYANGTTVSRSLSSTQDPLGKKTLASFAKTSFTFDVKINDLEQDSTDMFFRTL